MISCVQLYIYVYWLTIVFQYNIQNCLEVLYSTHIKVHISKANKLRYRIKKNKIAANVLEVCSQNMQYKFIYVLLQ